MTKAERNKQLVCEFFAILNLSSVAVIWFGGHLVDAGDMPIGNLTAFLTYLLQILMSVMMAVMITIGTRTQNVGWSP